MRTSLTTWLLATLLLGTTANYSPAAWADFITNDVVTVTGFVETGDGSLEVDGDLVGSPGVSVEATAEVNFVDRVTTFRYSITTGGVEVTSLVIGAPDSVLDEHMLDGGDSFVDFGLQDVGVTQLNGARFNFEACEVCLIEFTIMALPAWGDIVILGDGGSVGYNAGLGSMFLDLFGDPQPLGSMLAIGDLFPAVTTVPAPGALGLGMLIILAMVVVSRRMREARVR